VGSQTCNGRNFWREVLERGFLRLAGRAAEAIRVERPGDGKEAEDRGFFYFFWRLGGQWREVVQMMVDERRDAQIDNRRDL
jgi:hypothetical protein